MANCVPIIIPMDTLFTHDQIRIQAPPTAVWDALTNPTLTPAYMFGCEVLSEWKVGSTILWKGKEDGVLYVKGRIVTLEPEKKLAFTVFDPNASYEDIPANYLTATYTLEAAQGTTLLTVTQGDYAAVEDGAHRYRDTLAQGGWSSVLESIKNLLEQKAT